MNNLDKWIEKAIKDMQETGPTNLVKFTYSLISCYGDNIPEKKIKTAMQSLVHENANHPIRLAFFRALRLWDDERAKSWIKDTESFTSERRELIYEALGISKELRKEITLLCRIPERDDSAVSYDDYEKWFSPSEVWDKLYYWNKYAAHLQEEGWKKESIDILDYSTSNVLEKLKNPLSANPSRTKGLVVGYVQSGKTSHFTGLIAKAADAGYKVIIVLAGTLEILRDQTQRRLDRHLIGYPEIESDYPDKYKAKAVDHGKNPSSTGISFDWDRLTAKKADYKSLGRVIKDIRLEKVNQSLPINNKENLHNPLMSARLIVIKKNETRIKAVIKDFKKLESKGVDLSEMPVLLIDDESDLASLSFGNNGKREEANPTNRAIRDLIECFPRCQYVGYTATPFSNVLVDPENHDDLYPRDFIIPLSRPTGYMGSREFVDLENDEYEPDDMSSKKNAFIREIEGEETDHDLSKAIDHFILSGAIKLFRVSKKIIKVKHHTMLVHTDMKVSIQNADAENIKSMMKEAGYGTNNKSTLERLKKLYNTDFLPVSEKQGAGLPMPKSFSELIPFITSCWNKVQDSEYVRVVNDSKEANPPDFEEEDVWAVMVGGNKLSRGYTVEGLTISYFRRRCGAADTLLQMGRWFGFRKGYHDLIRVFMGSTGPVEKEVKDRKTGKIKKVMSRVRPGSIYDDFVQACKMEEKFREVIAVFNEENGRVIKPHEVPPLIYAYGLLPPVSANKLSNAKVIYRNFSGKVTETGKSSIDRSHIQENWSLFRDLHKRYKGWKEVKSGMKVVRPGGHKYDIPDPVKYFDVPLDDFIRFLESYQWGKTTSDRPPEISLLLHFLISKRTEHGVKAWRFISVEGAKKIEESNDLDIWVRERTRSINNDRFLSISDPAHRILADFLLKKVKSEGSVLNSSKEIQKLVSDKIGISICYSLRTRNVTRKKEEPVLVFVHCCPENNLPNEIGWGVEKGKANTRKDFKKKRKILNKKSRK